MSLQSNQSLSQGQDLVVPLSECATNSGVGDLQISKESDWLAADRAADNNSLRVSKESFEEGVDVSGIRNASCDGEDSG